MNKYILFIIILFTLMQLPSFAQNELDEKVRTQILNNTDTLALKSLKEKLIQKNKIDNEKINNLIQTNPNLLIRSSENGKTIELKEIKNGRPVYRTTFNRVAAQTTSTDDVWGSPFNLDGSGISIGLWDAGAVDEFHTSFREGTYGQKHVFFVDSTGSTVDNHSTHVAGTLVADNDYFNAKGMASKSIVISRDWNADVIEMTNAAALHDPNFPNGILLSNHSYGKLTGWAWSDLRKVGTKAWYWMAGNMDSEDLDFGNYNEICFDYDEIAFNAPNYTIVWAAGNDRGEGPEANAQHYYFDGSQWVSSTNYHVVDGGTDGYDCIPPDGVAKNIITVGAIDDIINGYQNSSEVKQINTAFSSWGPTKDGRIKPDIVANGDKLYSTFPNNAIDTMSGTSMAAPNVTGSIALLLQHYKNTHSGYIPLSSTVKAILIHTADESGDNPGPDYKYGWGLLNTYKAVQLISQDQTIPTTIQENDLLNGQSFTISNLYNDGTQPIKITLAWNDIPPVNMVGGPILMRDLDVRLTKDGITYYPYQLNPASPSSAATTGDNNKDNVEQIFLQSPGVGYYTVVVSHKGSISTQKYSLITTGFIEPFVTFYLKQLGNDNQPFGQAAYWDNLMWNNVPDTQHVTLSLDKHHFLSTQDFRPSTYEKFNIWEDNLSNKCYRNWDTLSLKATTTQVYSKFIPKITGITIKNSLEGTTVNGGNIKFKDPWLADVTEQPYGLRNQGMSAPFKNQTSPFSPDYTSSYNGDVYKGIFLNQSGPTYSWQGTYYSVSSLSEQTISVNGQNRKFYPFGWGGTGVTIQGPNWQETGVVFNTTNAVATATLKGQLMSNSTSSISSNSQRKMVRTDNGIYHVIYESMGNVFYTHSLTSNFAGDWAADQYIIDHAKNPAIEYDGNIVKAVCEYYDPTYSTEVELYLLTFTQQSNGTYSNTDDEIFATCPSSYFGSAKPVISYNSAGVALVYRKNSTEGLKLKTKWLLNGTWSWQAESTIPQTDANSINPSIIGETGIIHIAYESLSTIKYKQAYNQGLNWLYNNVITLSTGSGYSLNNYPSISLCNYVYPYVMVSWRGVYGVAGLEKPLAKEKDYRISGSAAVAKVGYGTSWGGYSSFGNNVTFTNNNSLNSYPGSVLSWSENNGQYSKFVKRNSGGIYGTITSLSTNGIQPLISNGSSLSEMKAMVFNTSTAAPYLLNKCTDNFYQGGGLEKIGETETVGISFGRSGVVEKNNIEFLFNIGDVQLDGQSIKFVERIDTLPVANLDELNTAARTESFSLNTQSELIFSNYYYIVNGDLADSLLTNEFNVTFKCELVNSATNLVVGTFDYVTYSKTNVNEFANPSYLVDCAGIEPGNYYLRLFTVVNEEVNLFVSDIQRDDIVLEKSNLLVRNFKGEGIPTVYDLAQNYPNPFNPSTTIRYQLPQDGMVTLKIYDILGSEVAILVNEQKAAGKYEVNFNASSLASGVYIYKIQAGDFNNSKKMILLK